MISLCSSVFLDLSLPPPPPPPTQKLFVDISICGKLSYIISNMPEFLSVCAVQDTVKTTMEKNNNKEIKTIYNFTQTKLNRRKLIYVSTPLCEINACNHSDASSSLWALKCQTRDSALTMIMRGSFWSSFIGTLYSLMVSQYFCPLLL